MIHIDWKDGSGRRDYAENLDEALCLVRDEHPDEVHKPQVEGSTVIMAYANDYDEEPIAVIYDRDDRRNDLVPDCRNYP